jgi:hypothetical protein
LLHRGDGREGIADFVGKVPCHLADEAEFVGLDFELDGAVVFGDVVEDDECGVCTAVGIDAEGVDADADEDVGPVGRGPFEGGAGLALLDDLEDVAAELLGEVAEVELLAAFLPTGGGEEDVECGLVGVDDAAI